MKSFSVIKFGLITALILTSIVIGICYLFDLSSISNKLIFASLTVFLSSFISSSFIFYWYVKQRIQNIYQMMDSPKSKTANKLIDKDIMNDVEADVMGWASKRQAEIDRLKETEEYRKEFIGNLAHELKTPVFSVQGYILTLLEGGLEDQTINRKFLQKAFKGIERITTVIEDMDTITRIESGILELDITKFDLAALVQDVFYELEEKASEKDISLKIDIKNSPACYVKADRSKIIQVVYNLINNSINYGNSGGETRVVLKPVKDKINISVQDNGLGIDKEHLPRLFERFYRVEKSRSRNKGGSGIGLAIVKHIMEAHNETIKVDSEVEKGTSFTFSLPKN